MTPTGSRVTALVTTYRPDLAYLRSAIESALGQQMPPDVIISDSGNDPSVRAFVETFGDRVRYRSNPTLTGPAENHRLALADVRTPYVALLGHDDSWQPDFLSTLVPPLDTNPECILAFSDHWFIDSSGKVDLPLTDRMTRHWGRAGLAEGRVLDPERLLLAQAVPVAMAAVLRTDDARRVPIPDESGPAYDLWLHYAMATTQRPYWYSPRRLTRWRYHRAAGTATGNPDWYSGIAFVWESVLADPRLPAIREAARARAADARLAEAKALLRRGADADRVRAVASRSLAMRPSWQARAIAAAPGLARVAAVLRDQVRR